MNRILGAVWALLLVGATIAGWQGYATPEGGWILPALAVLWLITLAGLIPSPFQVSLGKPLRWLRRHAILYWFLILVYLCLAIGAWVVKDQPTYGRYLTPVEFCYLFVIAWLFLYLLAYAMDRVQARTMGSRIGSSRLSGVLVTLTTLVVIFFMAEGGMRLFYITTDGYGFTAMNYWWYHNFLWGHYNSLGYRDYEPKPDDPAHPLTRVMVVGDSFAVGHGINNIDDTFPQMLEKQLGANYDVDLIAQSGWDTNDEVAHLEDYPLPPNVVVLSYYLNDMDYLLQDPSVNPNSNFQFPQDPVLSWVVINFFVPNYIYYDLLQFTNSTRTGGHAESLVAAHMDNRLWGQQTEQLKRLVDWTSGQNARLIILLWPQMAAIDLSAPAVNRVRDYFESRGVEVVDMSSVLRGRNVWDMILNRFDTHPSIAAHRLAADQLYQAIISPP